MASNKGIAYTHRKDFEKAKADAHLVFIKNSFPSSAVVAHTFLPSTWEAEAGGFLSFEASLVYRVSSRTGYTEKPCLKTTTTTPPPKKKKKRMQWFK